MKETNVETSADSSIDQNADVQPYSLDMVLSAGPEHDWERYYKLKPGDVFIEVGPFVGRYAMIGSRKGCSWIILIEPSPLNIATLENLLSMRDRFFNEDTKITIVKKAVTSEKGVVKFVAYGNSAGHRLSVGDDDYPGYTIEVEADTMENILRELGVAQVDLLASDCEGCEMDLVGTCGWYLDTKNIKNLAIGTYHGIDNHDIVSKILTEKGYKGIKYEDGVTYAHI